MEKGVITKIELERGFGFIAPSGERRGIFFHVTELSDSLQWNEQLLERAVLFQTSERKGRPVAVDVRPARS